MSTGGGWGLLAGEGDEGGRFLAGEAVGHAPVLAWACIDVGGTDKYAKPEVGQKCILSPPLMLSHTSAACLFSAFTFSFIQFTMKTIYLV